MYLLSHNIPLINVRVTSRRINYSPVNITYANIITPNPYVIDIGNILKSDAVKPVGLNHGVKDYYTILVNFMLSLF